MHVHRGDPLHPSYLWLSCSLEIAAVTGHASSLNVGMAWLVTCSQESPWLWRQQILLWRQLISSYLYLTEVLWGLFLMCVFKGKDQFVSPLKMHIWKKPHKNVHIYGLLLDRLPVRPLGMLWSLERDSTCFWCHFLTGFVANTRSFAVHSASRWQLHWPKSCMLS